MALERMLRGGLLSLGEFRQAIGGLNVKVAADVNTAADQLRAVQESFNRIATLDFYSLDPEIKREMQEKIMAKGGNKRFPSVTVLSERPAATGKVVKGKSGQGTIMSDEPNVVYVTSLPNETPAWYGHWPLAETDLAEVIRKTERKEKAQEIVAQKGGPTRQYVTYDGKIVQREDITLIPASDPEIGYLVPRLTGVGAYNLPAYRSNAVLSIRAAENTWVNRGSARTNKIAFIKALREKYLGLSLKEAKDVADFLSLA